MRQTEKIEVRLAPMVASNGKHIRMTTVIRIDGHDVRFTERLTKVQIAKYLASRQQTLEYCTRVSEAINHD